MLKVNIDFQSEYKLLKSNYDKINYKSITEDENRLYFYKGIPTVAIFDLAINFIENSSQSDNSKLTKKEILVIILMKLTRNTWTRSWI